MSRLRACTCVPIAPSHSSDPVGEVIEKMGHAGQAKMRGKPLSAALRGEGGARANGAGG